MITKEINLKNKIANFFQPWFREIVFDPKKIGYAFRSGRGVTKSIFDAFCVFMKLWVYPGTSLLVNVPEFSTLKRKFLKNLKDAIRIYEIQDENYYIHETINSVEFHTINPLGNSYICFEFTNKSDLSSQGTEPEQTNHLWCGRLDYEVGTWVNWTVRDYINYNATFARSCQYYKVVDGKRTLEKCEKNEKDKWTPYCIVAEYNMPSRDKRSYNFMKDLDKSFEQNDEWLRLKINYLMLTEREQEEFLGTEQLRMINNYKKYAPLDYKEIYEGEETVGNNNIYLNFDRTKALLPFNVNPLIDIDWINAKIQIGSDIGIEDATCFTCKVIWHNNNFEYFSRTIAQWFYSKKRMEYQKWDLQHRTKEEAMQEWEFKTPIQLCELLEDFYTYIFRVVYPFQQNGNKILLQLDTVGGIAGGTWYSILFNPKADGSSVLHPNQGGGTPKWLDADRVWRKFGKYIEERIPPFLHMFSIPGCYTTISELECDCIEIQRWDKHNKRDENEWCLELLTDVMNSIEYSFTYEQYFDFETFFEQWITRVGN